jgi:site-specific recombinase XerD
MWYVTYQPTFPAGEPAVELMPAQTLSARDAPGLVFFRGLPRDAWEHVEEFFAARIRNPNTRLAYLQGVRRFVSFCQSENLGVADVKAKHVAAWAHSHTGSVATIRLHLSGVRQLFDHLTVRGLLTHNPSLSVKNPRMRVTTGKTPVMDKADARILLDSIANTPVGKRDKALIAAMLFSFARISALLSMKVEDYVNAGRRAYLRLHEKGGRHTLVPVHPTLADALDAYLSVSGIVDEKKGPLSRAATKGRSGFSTREWDRSLACRMVKRRCVQAGLGDVFSCHTFRATGITEYLKAGGSLENAQQIAGHSSASTTKLYDRRQEEVGRDELLRIVI